MVSIFTSQTPNNANANGAPGLTLATLFTSSVNGTVSKIRWFWPLTTPSGTIVALYQRTDDSTGTLLGTGTIWDSTNTGDWNTCPLTVPVSITAGTKYYAAVFTADFFVSSLNIFTGGPIVNGVLTAPQNDDITPQRNGRFNATTPALSYPDNSVTGNCYFVDIIFTADVPSMTVEPDSISMTVSLGAPTLVDTSMDVIPTGLTLPISMGAPTVAGPPSPGRHNPVVELFTEALSCLCTAFSENPNPPSACEPRVGTEPLPDMGQFHDVCCGGLAYIMLGDTYFSSDSFPDQDIIRQVRGSCPPPTWGQNFRLGVLRCISAGTADGEPITSQDWTDAAIQNLYDSQSLRRAACCFREFVVKNQGEFTGMSVVVNRQIQGQPAGGCVERYMTISVQFPDADCPCP